MLFYFKIMNYDNLFIDLFIIIIIVGEISLVTPALSIFVDKSKYALPTSFDEAMKDVKEKFKS